MAKPWIRRVDGVWHVHDGMITRPVSSYQEGGRLLATRRRTMCLHEECYRQRSTNDLGVCDEHTPTPVPSRLEARRIASLENTHLRSIA